MIRPPGLTAAEVKALVIDLRRGPYTAVPSVQILDLEHNLLDDVSARLTDGQVDWKLGPVGRLGGAVSSSSVALTLADPRRVVALDRGAATKGAVFYDQMISASMLVEGPRIGRQVRLPLFTGPITKAVRSEGTLSVNAEGKERLATGMVAQAVTYRGGSDKVDVVRSLLKRAGESTDRIKTPGLVSNLPEDLVLVDTDMPWPEIRQLVASMNRQCFYDADGDFRMRRRPGDPCWSVWDGEGGTLLSIPEVTHDGYAGYNGVRVTGTSPGGRKISETVWLPPNHPLAPLARRRNGVSFKRYLVENVAQLRSPAHAREIAASHLRRMAREYVSVTANVMPNWLLEPGDVVAWRTAELGYLEQTLTEFSVPLLPGVPMVLGANRVISRPKPRTGKKPTRTRVPATQSRSAA